MLMLIAGVILFFVPHSVSIVAPHWRDRVVLHLGEAQWKGLYALLAAAGLALLILGFIGTSGRVLYVAPSWLHRAALVLMVPVFPLLLATYLPGRLQRLVRHPMLLAVQCWALAHLLVVGTLPAVVVFSAFLLWALLDRLSLRHRVAAPIRRAPPSAFNDVLALGIGLLLYGAFLWRVHLWVFGVSPW